MARWGGGASRTRVRSSVPSGPVRWSARPASPPPSARAKEDGGGSFFHELTHPKWWEIPFAAVSPGLTAAAHVLAASERGPKNRREAVGLLHTAAAPLPTLAARRGPKRVQGVARAAAAVGGSPIDVAAYPGSTAKNLQGMAVGLFESPYAITKSIQKHGFNKTMTMLWHATKADYQARYGKDWEKHARQTPLFNLADALMVLGPALKGAAIGEAASRLSGEEATLLGRARQGAAVKGAGVGGKTWADLSPAEKLKLARLEAKQPGVYTQGARTQRVLRAEVAPGKMAESLQPLSGGPLRGNVQKALDNLAQHFPDAPGFGAKSRVTRALGRQIPREMDRWLASVVDVNALKKLPNEALTRLYWESQLVKHAKDAGGDLVHDHAAVTDELKKLHKALSDEYAGRIPNAADDPTLKEWIRGAHAVGFGKPLLDRLSAAIKYAPDVKYEKAVNAMHDSTHIAEQVIRDTSGFSDLHLEAQRIRDQLARMSRAGEDGKVTFGEGAGRLMAQLQDVNEQMVAKEQQVRDMLTNRRGLVRSWLDVNTPVDAPERAAWASRMERLGWEQPQIQGALRASDAMARAHGDPVAFYRDRVGMPTGENAQQVINRLESGGALYQTFPEYGETALIEGSAAAPAETSAYYSRAQKQIAEAWGKKPYRQAGQVAAGLRKSISADEWRNSGLDNFFDQHGPNEMISQEQLQSFLATPLNKYNIHEIHYVGSQESWDQGFVSQYDNPYQYGNSLVSRPVSMEGQYHEILFVLPRDVESMYRGTGYEHWGIQNVTGHIRFQHFEENGVQKLVVEEIQSDWAADVRKERTFTPPPLSAARHQELAIDRVLRYAGENDVDEVIFPEAHVQHVRNGVSNEPAWVGDEFVPVGQPIEGSATADVRAMMDEAVSGQTPFTRMYEQQFPKIAEKRLGVKGEVSTNAYTGHFAVGAQESQQGPIRGTMFKLDDAARERATRPSPLYQRQPEWGKLPRGANEALGDGGKRMIHLFQNADVSTWLHELSHSAVHDLAAEDQNVLAHAYGGGKHISEWDTAAHENFARDFERFIREGNMGWLPRPVQAVFEKIQTWMQSAYRAAKAGNPDEEIPEQVQAVFRKMVTPESETPDIFIPHRPGAPDLTGGRMTGGSPRAARAISDEIQARIPFFKRNELALMRSGMIHDDPRLLIEHVNRLTSLMKGNQVREFLLQNATPIEVGTPVDFSEHYVVKSLGTNPNKVLYDAIESSDNATEVKNEISNFIDQNVVTTPSEYKKLIEGWRGDQRLYVVNKDFVDLLYKNVTGQKPGMPTRIPGNVAKAADTAMNSLRSLLLYGNPGFYVANLAGNFGMAMFNDPRSITYIGRSMKQALRAARGSHETSPAFQRVAVEMGRGPTAGGLQIQPNILGREAGFRSKGAMGAVDWWNFQMQRYGTHSGAVIDDAFRVGTWRREAAKLGYKTDEQVLKLLDDANKDMRAEGVVKADSKAIRDTKAIRDKAEQLMLDFDSLTPFERNTLARFVFIYPFLRASAKYPVMYASEHPFTFGAAAQASNVGQQFANQILGPRPDLPEWAAGYARGPGGFFNVGSIDQMNVLAGELQSVLGTLHGKPPDVGVNRAFQYLHPGVQLVDELLRRQNRYGREASYGEILRGDFPSPAWLSALYRDPSKLYTGRSELDAILRSIRLAPFGVNRDYGAGR